MKYKIADIFMFLDDISAFELQEQWDNSGLLVGNKKDTFDTICLTIDIDDTLLDSLPNNTLVISHHPMIFTPISRINFDDMATKFLYKMIKKDIKLISMHTNFDKTHLNRYFCENILGFCGEMKNDYLFISQVDTSFDKLLETISQKIDKKYFNFVKTKENIKDITIMCGSGTSFLNNITTDCFLTGDVKYHNAVEAKAKDISLIDIGHFESEKHFGSLIYKKLTNYLEHKEIKVIIPKIQNPQQEKKFE
ncbi:MAG: Nif3-like dinuclear metal center hexameric protein [Epsilonproteobacteria bacterium]|nr:MAG: Nif3-like dinuclear metal center hexameric protein [Campylobacterota bacterium]